MKKETIVLLSNLFGNSGEIVWITDENWKIQWGKYDYSKIQNLPDILNVSPELWENISGCTFFEEYFYEYTIYCSRENACRIIIMERPPQSLDRIEDASINNAVYSLRQVKNGFQQYFKENHLHEKKDLLDAIERSCLLLYRAPYITRIIDYVRSGNAVKSLFSVQDALSRMQKEMQDKLGIYAETDFSFPKKEVYLLENKEFFLLTVLAGLTLCHQERGYFHHAAFSLGVSGTKAELIINLTPDYQQPLDMSKQLDPLNFGSLEEEKKALSTFCIMHHGSWKPMYYHEKKKLISACCQICFQTDEYSSEITLNSERGFLKSDYDDVCRLMLSRIYLSEF
ncbi:MAG: hypothetical protein IJJ69_11950 [Oscillospiraceae bacterium]|nr:hypothetical protein [Oscillospiraceae bacterium]